MNMVATVEPNAENVVNTRPDGPSIVEAGTGPRFTYPSGSQPLSGYTIKRGIGHGGFGEVYYATSDAGKEVALKLVRRNLDVELRGVKQCLNLKHPNLLSIHDMRQDEHGDNWVIMEYVTGESLDEALANSPHGLPLDQTLAWFHGIAAGVACLHDHGIVHRDLKPGNVFSDEGVVKLGDYGLSKFISCSRRSGHTESVGTVHYMAPEIANGRYGKEIDVYALGVILYEMITGRVPFEGESVGEVLMKHLTTPPDVSMLDEPFRSVVARALAKDPAQRYSSVGEMLAALPRPVRAEVHAVSLSGNLGRAAARTSPGRTGAAHDHIPIAELVEEEPIARALGKFWRQMGEAWNRSQINTPAKVALVIVAVVAVMRFAPILLPFSFFLLVLYALYWVVRLVVLALASSNARAAGRVAPPYCPPPQPPSNPFQATGTPFARPMPPQAASGSWFRERAVENAPPKPARERATELIGSMLGSAFVALVMALVMLIIKSYSGVGPRLDEAAWVSLVGHGMWLGLVSIAGAWSILVPSKFWEGGRGDAALRRFLLMVIGLGLGAMAWVASDMLQVGLAHDPQIAGSRYRDIPGCYDAAGRPLLMAFLAAFAALFFVLRWWRQTDPLRPARLSLFSMIVSVVAAWLVAGFLGFPPAGLMMIAGVISVSVQLSSPWTPPHTRRLRENGR